MNVTLSLNPEIEKTLIARAQARGLSLDAYLQELVAGEAMARLSIQIHGRVQERFDNLSDLLLNSPFAGANLDLERSL